MRRSRAPSFLVLACVWLSVMAWPLAAEPESDDQASAETSATRRTATTPAAADPTPPVVREVRRDNGFVCERRTVAVNAASTSFKVEGTIVLGKADCHECCQENALLVDGFESGDTSAWSYTQP